ncbi:hypothetical protein CAAN1_18S01156 [[Candida] anglica]|uniref:Myosin-binding domain-containing protein n=1 Tax=[Candida] anglica TaxID=148631 RepID=A0ABP0ELU2_9ASCO
MNFGFNPLASYLSHNGVQRKPIEEEGGPEISDWGIEETTTSSRHTSISQHRYHSIASPTLIHEPQFSFKDYGDHATHTHRIYDTRFYFHGHITTTSEISLYIKKYLSLNGVTAEFWDKFKYDLIVSNFLDDSMILSKNEQSLKELSTQVADSHDDEVVTYSKKLNDDGTRLVISSIKYNMKFPQGGYNSFSIIQCVHFIILTLKLLIKRQISYDNTYKMLKIILIISTRAVHSMRVARCLQIFKLKKKLQFFLLNNYKINKHFMTNLLQTKELQMFGFLNNSSINNDKKNNDNETNNNNNNENNNNNDGTNRKIVVEQSDILDHAISLAIGNITCGIKELLPHMNGPIFEKYCSVNNVNWCSLQESLNLKSSDSMENNHNSNGLIYRLTRKLSRFNQLRKLFVCQLLTINELPSRNFFLSRVCDEFSINDIRIKENMSQKTSISGKFELLNNVMGKQIEFLKSHNIYFDTFQDGYRQNIDNEDILSFNDMNSSKDIPVATVNDNNISQLIEKLSAITTNLKYFQKYNNSTQSITDFDELNEKLYIFSQFGDDIDMVKELHQVSLGDFSTSLQSRMNGNSPSSSGNSSRRNSRDGSSFNLKTFHTPKPNSIKKRYSLPSSISETQKNFKSPISSPVVPQIPNSPGINNNSGKNEKKYKRLSAGLPIGLLTVFEEPKANQNGIQSKRTSSTSTSSPSTQRKSTGVGITVQDLRGPTVCYDDNYINILPPASYYSESYNQAALDSLSSTVVPDGTRKSTAKVFSGNFNNRYSLTSMNSNVSGISDLIASTHITSYNEEEKDEMKLDDSPEFYGELNTQPQSTELSKEALKLKLEESFNRIYKLESQNSILKQKNANIDDSKELDDLEADNNISDSDFLRNLESTLSRKVEGS